MRKSVFSILVYALALLSSHAQLSDPFTVEASLVDGQVDVRVAIPDKHYLYAKDFKVTDALGNEQKAMEIPATVSVTDPNTGEPEAVYNKPFSARYAWEPQGNGAAAIHVQYWGCNDQVCFIPRTKVVALTDAAGEERVAAGVDIETADWKLALAGFETKGVMVGSMRPAAFLRFLDQAENGFDGTEIGAFSLFLNDPVAFVRESGLLVAILFIFAGGLALNLTPCVLPMIPVNLAIIGAGARSGSKGRGFALGGVYGLGIALVYGLLGVVVVLTGSQFGTIQANPWFNLVIALIFVVLALAMFDIIHIDFSRFQSKFGSSGGGSDGFMVALGMGAVSALLAGACVAPVVIAVLLLATNIYEANNVVGLLLPFVLGFGMALPWPFAGAGLSFLPKPGKWMVYIKYGFGIGIIFFALYYGRLSYRAFLPDNSGAQEGADGHVIINGANNDGLAEAILEAREAGKPIFIDFWASWCKNCKAMDRTTFRDMVVKERLADYLFIKYVAEDFGNPETQSVIDHFGIQGLPTFVVLDPRGE